MFRWRLQYFAARSGGLIEDLFGMLMNFQIFDTKWLKVQNIQIVTPTLVHFIKYSLSMKYSLNLRETIGSTP